MGIRILQGDCRAMMRDLPAKSVQTCVTSPPYFGLRDYGVAGQIGLEPTPDDFVAAMVDVFREVRRVLADDGTLWLNLGDSYSGAGKTGGGAQGAMARHSAESLASTYASGGVVPPGYKAKDLMGIPWRVAFALQADGWWLRSDIIWHKPNPMPESVTDRPTSAHEHVFLLAKSERYFYDADAVKEAGGESGWSKQRDKGEDTWKYGRTADGNTTNGVGGTSGTPGLRNLRNVWTVATQPYSGAHFATFPPALIEPCIKAGSRPGDTVLDPFGGAGTTGLVADRLGRNAILTELNQEYAALAQRRIQQDAGMFSLVEVVEFAP